MINIKESILLNIVLPLAEGIMGLRSSYWYRQIQMMNGWSRAEIESWQNTELQRFVRHAYEHTAYYKRLFDELGLKPEDVRCKSDLRKLPVLTKDEIRAHTDELIADNASEYKHRSGKTGGTTGDPMYYKCDEDVWGYVTAAKRVAWKTTPFHFGDKFVALGSASLFNKKPSLPRRIYDLIRNEVALNSMNLSDEICEKYLQKFRRENIRFIYGYASSIYLLARYAREHNIDLTFIQGVFTTSENLTDDYRRTIEQVTGCRVMDCYGCRDAGLATYEVLPHKYFVGYNTILETTNEWAENTGTLLSTNILNYSMPLLRYNFGDDATLLNFDTEYNGQVITKIYGRTSDVLRLDNGHVLTSPGFTILMNDFDVAAYDIQKISGTEVKVQIQPIPDKFTKEQQETIRQEIQRFVGLDSKLSIELVKEFAPLPNGKRRYFMNDLAK